LSKYANNIKTIAGICHRADKFANTRLYYGKFNQHTFKGLDSLDE